MVAIKHIAPTFTEDDARRIAAELYGIQAEPQALPGEHDRNFHLKTADGAEYVLKISHAAEQRDLLDLQNAALAHLAAQAPTLALPRVQATLAGELLASLPGTDGASHFVRLLTYVPGRLFAVTDPHTPELLHSLGTLLGTMDRALLDFSHPAADRELKWDIPRAVWIRDYLHHISAPARRTLVERFLAEFERDTLPLLPDLRASVIYNDANDYNIVVDANESGQRRVVGVIDFGDMTRTTTVCELAIALAYAMMGKPDPLAAGAQVVAGYHAALPLTEAELAALYPLALARLCVSVTNSAYQQSIDPANEYLQISDRPAWELLERLAEIPAPLAHYTFRHACGLPAVPAAPTVVRWLTDHRAELGRIVEPDLATEPAVIFDLSIGSRDLGNFPDFEDADAFTRNLFAQMAASQTSVGIGRYNETRPIYTTDAYKIAGNDGPEWRTVHLGLDVFMAAGAPVFAPLDGVVHSFRNNDAPKDYGPTIILEHTVNDGSLTFYTLYGHLSLDSLDRLSVGMPVRRGARIASMGDETVNGGWPPHLHFQIITDLLGQVGEFPGVGRPSERGVRLSLSPDPNLIARIPAERLADERMSSAAILAARKRHLGGNLSISYQQPLKIVRGYMQHLYDEDGRAYLDAVNNVPHVGHSHPRVVQAGQRQMAVLNTNTRYLHEDLARYAERLCATLPDPLSVCYFVCSGSEANELALRLARTHTRRRDVVVVDVAYHGNTGGLIEISPYKAEGQGGAGLPPWVHKTPMPDTYRGAYKRDDPHAGGRYASDVAAAIERARAGERSKAGGGNEIAAFICESVLGCGGQIVLPDGYLSAAYQHVRAAGGVCIADEVQTGFGRVGSHFWAFETQGVVPDIVTMGKPMGNGHPLAAVVTTPEIAASFDNGMEYFNTFGGNPVSCAIGLAVLDVIADEQLQAHALETGNHLLAGLRALMPRYPLIGDVRGLGLFIGIELVLDRATLAPAAAQAAYIANRMRARGVLLSTDGPFHNVLKIKPPMPFNTTNADFLLSTLERILAEDDAQP